MKLNGFIHSLLKVNVLELGLYKIMNFRFKVLLAIRLYDLLFFEFDK